MSLTIKEKEHWKELIERSIDHAIEELQAKDGPGFYERINAEADEQAWTTLGLNGLRDEHRQIASEQVRLREREEQIHRKMLARVSGVPLEDIGQQYYIPQEVQRAAKRRRDAHVREILGMTGRSTAQLRLVRLPHATGPLIASATANLRSDCLSQYYSS